MILSKLKPLFIETSWLLLAIIITISICSLVFGKEFFQNSIGINLHDTYFVIPSFTLFAILFIKNSFVLYLIKENQYVYSRRFHNIITIIFGFALLISLSKILNLISVLTSVEKFSQSAPGSSVGNGWSVFPPLEFSKYKEPVKTFEPLEILSYFIIFIQLIVGLLMIRLGYKWGKTKSI